MKSCTLALLLLIGSSAFGQYKPDYVLFGKAVIASLSAEQLAKTKYSFSDTIRQRWQRLPGERSGLKLTEFNEAQKIALHYLLRNCLSSQGYLTVTSVMFNEDIQKKVEPNLGRNEFWFELFGDPDESSYWAFKLEGHHLSVNITLHGNAIVSHTPFLVATNPAITKTDGDRDGLMILYPQENLGRKLVTSLSNDQLKNGYSSRAKPEIVYGEQDKKNIVIPNEGIPISDLNPYQRNLVELIVLEFSQNFHMDEVPQLKSILNQNARFFFIGSTEPGKPHYYRIENGVELLEYENYDNHIHCFWRNKNDFAKLVGK